MSYVKLRMHRENHKRNPIWYIIAQPKNKSWDGRNFLEKLGVFYPKQKTTVDRSININSTRLKYWLAHGAQPTNSVFKFLHKLGYFPKPPIPYGNKYIYEKPKKELTLEDFNKFPWGKVPNDLPTDQDLLTSQFENLILDNLKYLQDLIDNKKITAETLQNASSEINELTSNLNSDLLKKRQLKSDCDTEEVDSDEKNFLFRKRNFDIVSKKMRIYTQNNYFFEGGNTFKFYRYHRKLEKLARNHGIDELSFQKFNDIITALNEKNKLLSMRLSFRFTEEFSKSNEFKENFFKHFNNGKSDDALFEKFVKQDIDEIYKLYDKRIDNYFKRTEEKDVLKSIFSSEEKNKEVIKDYVCLRFAKLMKKMKEAFLINKNNNSNSNSNLPSDYNLSDLASKIKKNFYNALEKDEILFDSNLKEKSNQILNEKDQGLQTVFFNKVNSILINSETFKKYKDRLFLKESNNILNMNDTVIERLCEELEEILNKNFELNDIYNDTSNQTLIDTKNSKEIGKRLNNLKQKYGDINEFIDKKEVKDLYNEFKYELIENNKLAESFKQTYRNYLLENEVKDFPEIRKKFIDTYNKALDDIVKESKNEKEKYNFDNKQLMTEEERNYFLIRKFAEEGLFDETRITHSFKDIIVDESLFVIDRNFLLKGKPLRIEVKKNYKPEELEKPNIKEKIEKKKLIDEKFATKKILNDNIYNSVFRSYKIEKLRVKEMLARFEEIFGGNENIYPIGFNHLKSFSNYQASKSNATQMDYKNEGK